MSVIISELAKELLKNEKISFLNNDLYYTIERASENEGWMYSIYCLEDIPKDDENNYLFSEINEDDVFDGGLFEDNGISYDGAVDAIEFMLS